MLLCCGHNDLINGPILYLVGIVSILCGLVLILLDVSSVGIVLTNDTGNWWFAMFILATGFMGVCVKSERILVIMLVFSIIGILVTLIGVSVNASKYFQNIRNIETCYSNKNEMTYGNQDYKLSAYECYLQEELSNKQHDCYCVSHSTEKCLKYNLEYDWNSCKDIVTSYKQTLLTSVIVSIIGLFALTFSTVIASLSLNNYDLTTCCNKSTSESRAGDFSKEIVDYLGREDVDEVGNGFTDSPVSSPCHKVSNRVQRQRRFIQFTKHKLQEAHDLYVAMLDKPYFAVGKEDDRDGRSSGGDASHSATGSLVGNIYSTSTMNNKQGILTYDKQPSGNSNRGLLDEELVVGLNNNENAKEMVNESEKQAEDVLEWEITGEGSNDGGLLRNTSV